MWFDPIFTSAIHSEALQNERTHVPANEYDAPG